MPNRVEVTLTVDGSSPAPNLNGLEWAFFNESRPSLFSTPSSRGSGATTNASGLASLVVETTLQPGQFGWLDISNSNGNPNSDHSGYSGPVVVGAAVGNPPTISAAPAIVGSPTVGTPVQITPGSYNGTQPFTIARTWRVDGAVVSTASSYTPVQNDSGRSITVAEVATNALGSSPSNLSQSATVQAAGPDTRPRYGIAASLPANPSPSNIAGLLAALAPIPDSLNGGKAGTFTITTPDLTSYGWVAVLASVSTAGVLFREQGFVSSWSGASTSGPFTGAATLGPSGESLSTLTYTDGNGTTWRFFRQELPGSAPAPGVAYQIS